MHTRPSRTNEAYRRLRERIASGELPPGSVVSEAKLAKELGISRTPVGEALRRLSQDGLVDQVPRYGTIVREVSSTELAELFEIREALEGMAAGKAAERITAEALAELGGLCETIDDELNEAESASQTHLEGEALSRFLAADMAFHMLIIVSAGNHRLSGLIENTRSLSSMFKARRGEHSLERIRLANQAHRDILNALVERDRKAATRLVVSHIRSSCEHSLKDRAIVPPPSLGTLNLPPTIRRGLERRISNAKD